MKVLFLLLSLHGMALAYGQEQTTPFNGGGCIDWIGNIHVGDEVYYGSLSTAQSPYDDVVGKVTMICPYKVYTVVSLSEAYSQRQTFHNGHTEVYLGGLIPRDKSCIKTPCEGARVELDTWADKLVGHVTKSFGFVREVRWDTYAGMPVAENPDSFYWKPALTKLQYYKAETLNHTR